jgi:hypothetical protein
MGSRLDRIQDHRWVVLPTRRGQRLRTAKVGAWLRLERDLFASVRRGTPMLSTGGGIA